MPSTHTRAWKNRDAKPSLVLVSLINECSHVIPLIKSFSTLDHLGDKLHDSLTLEFCFGSHEQTFP